MTSSGFRGDLGRSPPTPDPELEKAKRLWATEIEVRTNSQRVVEQLNAQYMVKNERLKVLHAHVLERLNGVH